MSNTQFRMKKKRLGASVCADISQYVLKNQYIQFLYKKKSLKQFFSMKILFFVGFWIEQDQGDLCQSPGFYFDLDFILRKF